MFNFDRESERSAADSVPEDPLRADHSALADVYEVAALVGPDTLVEIEATAIVTE